MSASASEISASSDLSAYEIARLANIRRNQAELVRLGLVPKVEREARRKKEAELVAASQGKRKRASNAKRETAKAPAVSPQVRRRSKRLQNLNPDGEREGKLEYRDFNSETALLSENDEEGPRVDYLVWPHESSELDSNEFLIYVKLRAWRLKKKNELQCEPYKICMNRTLCELIRRCRNDRKWASFDSPTFETELVECWGVGPAKAADTPKGFGRMLMRLMVEDDEICRLLEKSRLEPEVDSVILSAVAESA